MQGFNMGRYYPPDADAAPAFNQQSHPLGSRAKKINQGILTVRFELPYAVWCTNCKPEAIVGQGVRFNAEKKKIGNYHSTPIWSFRMKHTPCGQWWEIQTDPKNSAYKVVSGARKRDYGEDDVKTGDFGNDEMAFMTEEERERRRQDAFAAFEKGIESRAAEKINKDRITELYEKSEIWKDPYTMNQKLRREFRAGRKLREKADEVKLGLQDKLSFGYEIADEKDIDRVKASMIEFGTKDKLDEALKRPMFDTPEREEKSNPVKPRMLKSEAKKMKAVEDLRRTLTTNTRAAMDPFLNEGLFGSGAWDMSKKRKRPVLPSIHSAKQKHTEEPESREVSTSLPPAPEAPSAHPTPVNKLNTQPLVDYLSDSE